MSRLLTRLKKLEASVTDSSRLIPHTPAWFEFWGQKASRILNGEHLKGEERIPLEYFDALRRSVATADLDEDDQPADSQA